MTSAVPSACPAFRAEAGPVSDRSVSEAALLDVRVEQVALLYDGMPAAIVANVLIGGCVLFALAGLIPSAALGLWAALLAAALILRSVPYVAVRRYPVAPQNVCRWEALFTLGACATGIVWGMSLPLLGVASLPESDRWFAYTIVIVCGAGIAAAGVFTMSYRIAPPRLFVGTILLPALVYLGVGGTKEKVAAALVLIFLGFLYRSSASAYSVSLNNLRLRREAMADMELHLLLFERSPLPMWVYDVANLRFLQVNDRAIEHYGYTRDEFGRMTLRDIVPARDAPEPAPPVAPSREARHRRKDGALIDVVIESTPVKYGSFEARLDIVQDVTERRQSEQRERSRRIVMELLTAGAPLATILEAIVRGVETASTAMLCGILLLDKRGERLYTEAAPSLPPEFSAAVDGLEIGIGAGSCGTAAYTGKQVIVVDVQIHPYWAKYREIAARANLRACWSEPIRAASGKVLGTFAIYYRDVHRPTALEIAWVRQFVELAGIALERAHAADALRASEARFRSLTHLSADWYWEQDEHYRFTEISEGIVDHSGIEPASFIGKTRWECEPPGAKPGPMLQHREQLERHEAFHDLQIERVNANGETRIISVSGEPVFDAEGTFQGFRGVGSDITERKRLERELEALATTDSLTGLANRRQFLLRVEHELARLRRNEQPAAVLMIDLDHFKRVNDRYGHAVGDAVLRHYAILLQEGMRAVDLAGRMGGEEFAILLPGADAGAASVFAERLRASTEAHPLIHDGQNIAVTASFGVAAMTASDASASDVLKRADAALYRAKQGGRNRVAGPLAYA